MGVLQVRELTEMTREFALQRVLAAVADERRRQDTTWGAQNHPDGTGRATDRALADHLRYQCDYRMRSGIGTWRDVVDEELAEAYAETDLTRLRAELVQLAAVVVAWIEAIDRRTPREGGVI